MADGLARFRLIDTGGSKLSLQAHEFALFFEWDGEIVLRENGDDISGLKCQVILFIAFQHQFPQIKGNKAHGEVLRVQALNYGVVPVDLRSVARDLVAQLRRRRLGRSFSRSRLPLGTGLTSPVRV